MSYSKIISIQENGGETSYIAYYPSIDIDKEKTWEWLNAMDDFRGGDVSFLKNPRENEKKMVTRNIPRKQKWYAKNYFTTEWNAPQYYRWQPCKYDTTLIDLQEDIYKKTSTYLKSIVPTIPKFNSCLINVYKDGNDSINLHSDSHIAFGLLPTIAVLSFGDTRRIHFKRRIFDIKNPRSLILDKENEHLNQTFDLAHGSCLIMAGATQKYFAHEIPKDDKMRGHRFSLSFRNHILSQNK
jgi:alkylated DNA repair dioxygenase AlkB